ncbi:uncharacterized protein TrAtP1_004098 [Trichoderma atroviride]|uniref:uncharacterized protein n=1 Tax=Hypocrea atroviridis TaxID=63577 RepID=UPI003332E77F|nr:hypothetical protein TrAtP1_004098 [Trichoderma atroviride]
MARPDVSAVEETPSLQPQAVSRAIQRVDIDAASATVTGSRLWFRLAEQTWHRILSSRDILLFV